MKFRLPSNVQLAREFLHEHPQGKPAEFRAWAKREHLVEIKDPRSPLYIIRRGGHYKHGLENHPTGQALLRFREITGINDPCHSPEHLGLWLELLDQERGR